jgi:hypothetical protein
MATCYQSIYCDDTYSLIRTVNFTYVFCRELLGGFKIIVFLHTLQLILQKIVTLIWNILG